ncbi:MAG: LysM peptidoglycan-binding domain-containing protein [Ruminococcus sp.]
MRRRKNTRNRRRIQLIITFLCFLFCTGFMIQNSARKIGAESDLSRITYKYYKSYYIETGDSLWSIAKEHMTDEYSDINEYIAEVKKINHLSDNTVKQGTHICIPYYSMEHK